MTQSGPIEHDETYTAILSAPHEHDAAPTTPLRSLSRRRVLMALAVVLVCGTVATALGAYFVFVTKVDNQSKTILTNFQHTPAVFATLTAKRDSMKLHGASTAEAYIFPRGGQTLDGTMSFDALVALRNDQVVTTYTLLNDRVYMSTASATSGEVIKVSCLEASQVPPIHLMAYSLSTSTVLDEVKGTDGPFCADGKLLQLSFAGESFVFCTAQNNKLQRATSDDLDVVLQYVSDPTQTPDLVAPVNGTTPLDCPIVVSSDIPTPPVPSYMETASMVLDAATGPARSYTIKKSSCDCRQTPRPCLFVHGVGVTPGGPIVDSLESYWGSIHEHAPCCSTTKFVQFDTVSQGWTDPKLQRGFCNAALQTSRGATQNTVGSLILVAHSMGNLIAGGAVASGLCRFSSNVTWMSLSAPMQGSQTTNFIANRCAATNNWFDKAFSAVLGLAGFCPSPRAYVQLQHQSTADAAMQAKFTQAQAVRRTHGAHNLCGTNSFGLATGMSIPLAAVGAISGHGNRVHDGVVDLSSCMAGVSSNGAGADTTNFHYMAAVNHLDTSFRYGDGWWGSDRKPQKWFECAL